MISQQSKFLLLFLVAACLVSVAVSYWHFMIQHDFVIINDVDESEAEEGGDLSE